MTACLDHELGPLAEDDGSEGAFIALQRDFQGFRSWPDQWFVGEGPTVDIADSPHLAGERWVYTNALPTEDDAAFPTGTIIVKVHQIGAPVDWEILAMVKRGGTFNERGAVGWEWFDLALTEDDAAVIVWRGTEPPAGAGYGCLTGDCTDTTFDCNACHMGAVGNDYVQTPDLDFSAQFAAQQDHGS